MIRSAASSLPSNVIRSEETRGVSGWCPDPTDLAVSKLAAWREESGAALTILDTAA